MRNNQNPWVGLRAYTEGEILYGRDKDILELTTYVMAETEVVLYGKSGTGKSSIINAGIIPSARRNGYTPLTVRLEHAVDSPRYVVQIINAIKKAGIKIKNVVPYADDSCPLLWEFFHCNEFVNEDGLRAKLLIIFDQFEEIFTLQESNEVRVLFFKEIADLLNDIKPRELCNVENCPASEKLDDSEQSPSNDIFALIENLDINISEDSNAYAENNVHFVFTLREDYLSDFEYHTHKIPVLKQHRYAFRPIDENQAMEIIVNPQKGLVSERVARQIIAKISKSSDGEITSSTGVDTAILSLFLSQLYQRLPENATSISTDMLDKFGKDIIKDFYIASVSDSTRIRPEAVRWIENILLTKDNHRDNKDIKDVLDKTKGLTLDELDYLEKEKRILTRFKRSKITRIEFVHDIIADVAAQHKQDVDAEIIAREKQLLQERKAKRKIGFTILVSAIIVILSICIAWSFFQKQTDILPVKQSFMISFLEDSLTTENEYWKGDFSVIGHRVNAPDTLLFQKAIDKGLRDSVFRIEVDTLRSVSFLMKFPSYSKYQDVEFKKDYSELVKALSVPVQLRKKQPKTYQYLGNVSVESGGIKWPVQNALVCLHDITARTDSCGNFKYYLENELSDDDDIFIIKKGFSSIDFKAVDNLDENVHNFVLSPKDSIESISYRIAAIDSIARIPGKTVYQIKKQKIFKKDGSTDILFLYGVYNKTVDKKYLIDGYFYFLSDMRKGHEDNLCAYYIFSGEIDRNWKDGLKNYSIEGKNYIGNVLNMTGTYKQKVGSWTGEISSPVGYNATFPE